MEKEQYRPWCSMTPLVCSIIPIGIAGFVGLVVYAFPKSFRLEGGCFLGTWDLIPCCIGPLIALVMAPMGTYSILSGIGAVKEPEARGKTLVAVGIILGIFDIIAGTGYLFWIFSRVF